MSPRKSIPKGIDPAYPNENFVKSYYKNTGQEGSYSEYMFMGPGNYGEVPGKKTSGYGHGIGQRAGKLRLSGAAGAHRVGKRNRAK